MKIQLVLSGTYLFRGKVFQRKDGTGKALSYSVSKQDGDHLLSQRNERDVPYFRLVQDDVPAVLPAAKRVEKGGVPQPESEAPVDDEPAAHDVADDEAVTADDLDDEEDEEAVAL
jgi:hypothetical protein